jgi:hypothetical protein
MAAMAVAVNMKREVRMETPRCAGTSGPVGDAPVIAPGLGVVRQAQHPSLAVGAHDVSDAGIGEGPLDVGGGVIEELMKWAEPSRPVTFPVKRAFLDAMERADGSDHIQHCQVRGLTDKREAAVETALGTHQAELGQLLEHLGQVIGGNPGSLGNLVNRPRPVVLDGEVGDSSEGVFGGK